VVQWQNASFPSLKRGFDSPHPLGRSLDDPAPERALMHPGLAWLEGSEAGRDWLARLPDLVGACARDWDLRLGDPFPYAFASLALPGTRTDGEPVVLKIAFPDRESEHEPDALAAWDGDGAVRLLAHDAARGAMLLERCDPGIPLKVLEPDRALDVLVELLPRTWVPAGPPFRSLAEEAARWADDLEERWERGSRPFERRIVDEALELVAWLPGTQADGPVLLNQDLHADNVLRARREPWLMIDPKPLAGERAFGLSPIVRGAELGHGARAVRGRLDRLSAELGVDRARARGWTIVQTLAWAFDDDVLPVHLDVVRWLRGTVPR
jgi:streptomycin 6-kinase